MDREGMHTSPENLLFYVHQVIESTAENTSSMLQDILAQRHTEIDYITGYLLNAPEPTVSPYLRIPACLNW